MNPTESERRRQPRVPKSAYTEILVDTSTVVDGRTIDVSRGGSLIDSPIPLGVGHPLELRIHLGQFHLKPVRAKVKRSNPVFWGNRHLVAVEFDAQNDAILEVLEFEAKSESWKLTESLPGVKD